MNNSSRGSQADQELLVRQEQMILLAQAQYERRQRQKEKAGTTTVSGSTLSGTSRAKSDGAATVITMPDDGLSMMSTSERSISGGGGSSTIPAHIQREQEQLLRQLSSRGGGRGGGAATISPSHSYSDLCESSPATALVQQTQQQLQRRRSDRIRQRDSFTEGYSLPNQFNHHDYYGASSPHSSSRSLSAYSLPSATTPGVAASVAATDAAIRAADWEAKQQTQIPQVSEAIAAHHAQQQRRAARNGRTTTQESTPRTGSSAVDVDDIIVERVKQCSIKVSRQPSTNSNFSRPEEAVLPVGGTSSPSGSASFDDFRVGAFNIRNAGDKPTPHPSDTGTPLPPQYPQGGGGGPGSTTSSRSSRVPPLIQQQRSESEQSQTMSTMTPRTAFTNEPIPAVPVADLVLQEEPCAPPLPATIVRSSNTQVRIAQPPTSNSDGGDPNRNGNNGGSSSNSIGNLNYPLSRSNTAQKSTLSYVLVGGGCGVVFLTIVLLLCRFVEEFDFTGKLYKEPKPKEVGPPPTPPPASIVPTIPPTPGPTPAPTPFVLDLPSGTIDSILNNPVKPEDPNNNSGSPQARAYRWLVEDLKVNQDSPLSIERQYQRFALATLYFATNQYGAGRGNSGEVDNSQSRDTWKRSGGWLDHNVDECEWETPASVGRGLPLDYKICNSETGLYESLVLNDNGLIGYIPPEISLLTTIKILDLNRNDLNGLPSQLGLLTNLEYFDFYFAYGNGPVPSEFGKLTNLKVLNLERNDFSDTIPTQIGLLWKLQRLEFEQNSLQGTLPSELGSLLAANLWSLNVNYNDLSGTIPDTFNDAMAIRKSRHGQDVVYDGKSLVVDFDTIGNRFTGIIPDEMCSLRQRLDFHCEDDGDPEEGLCGCDWCPCAVTAGAAGRGDPDAP